MKAQEWRSYFSPREWAVFHREAARRGMTADELAAKYLCRAIDRIELAEKQGWGKGGKLERAMQHLRRAAPAWFLAFGLLASWIT